jgi:hypothetical protein
MVLPGPFYLNNVLVTFDIIRNLLFVHQFIIDNWCSIEFDLFDLSVNDLAIRNVVTRCNSSETLYTIRLPTTRAPQVSTYFALTVVTTPRHSSTVVSVTLASTLCRSSLLLVRLSIINPKIFLSAMLASSIDILDFRFICCHLMLHSVLI